MLSYETLLDLARQRLDTIAASPKHTREARHIALGLKREVETELAKANTGHPLRKLINVGEAVDGLVALGTVAKAAVEIAS